MRPTLMALLALCLLTEPVTTLPAQDTSQHKAKYVKRYEDPVLKEMEVKRKAAAKIRDKATRDIRDRQEKDDEKKKAARTKLRFDFGDVEKPASPEDFERAFYFPPVAQYYTGTCWCFAGTSFMESEVARIKDKQIKLSEMYTVYHEYLEKARRYIGERGKSEFGEGSECNAVVRMFKLHGAMPADAYRGVAADDGRHDHTGLFRELQQYLQFIKAHDTWDEESNLKAVRVILDKYLGRPPATFEFEGQTYTPKSFVRDGLGIPLDDYVVAMSTMAVPFYTKDVFDVPDNWWRCADYHNLPLDEWYAAMQHAVQAGYTVALGGDTSEPGYDGFEDAAIVPDFDVPQTHINQSSRELRFVNRSTTDDHAIHLVGHAAVADRDWFLIKDSARGCRHGKCKGYYFYRDDYVRLKMLAFLVHKDALAEVLEKFDR